MSRHALMHAMGRRSSVEKTLTENLRIRFSKKNCKFLVADTDTSGAVQSISVSWMEKARRREGARPSR